MDDKELWNKFCLENNIDVKTPYEAWAFGAAPDKLLDLVLKGIKVATASGYDLYLVEKQSIPKEGDYSVILNSKGEAKCVIQTTKISIIPFNEVDSDHAYKEGEGDKSLTYWRKVHIEFFEEEYQKSNIKFTQNSKIICEEFKLVYKV